MKTVKPRLSQQQAARVKTVKTRDVRMTGSKLQSRRLKMWANDPHCVMCDRVVAYPHGFELDHIVALDHGGADDESNLQVLCVHWADDGSKLGCHAVKTADERRPSWL